LGSSGFRETGQAPHGQIRHGKNWLYGSVTAQSLPSRSVNQSNERVQFKDTETNKFVAVVVDEEVTV